MKRMLKISHSMGVGAVLMASGALFAAGAASAQMTYDGTRDTARIIPADVSVSIGWHGERYWDGHRYWEHDEWMRRHPHAHDPHRDHDDHRGYRE